VVRVFLNQRHSVFTRGPCLIKSAPQCSLCHASVSWSVLGAVVVLKARPSWVKLKSWLIPSSTTPRGYYFHPFPDDRAEGAKYRFSGFTPNKQTNKQTNMLPGNPKSYFRIPGLKNWFPVSIKHFAPYSWGRFGYIDRCGKY